jgi:cobalamin biosynthesis Mg chelatase CobN
MRAAPNRSRHTTPTALLWVGIALVLAMLATAVPAAATTTSTTSTTKTHNGNALDVPVPASERVHGATTTPATTTPAGSTPAATTPAGTTPAATTPATVPPTSGAQPGTVAPTTTTPATVTPTTATPPAPAGGSGGVVGVVVHKSPQKSTRLSTGALALVILGALLLLGCLVWGVVRWLALEPRWGVSLMYSLRETGYRASATWAEFSDWVRLGH